MSKSNLTKYKDEAAQYGLTFEEMKASGTLPKGWVNKEQAVQAIQFGISIGMSPHVALQSLEYIQGNLSIKSKMIGGLLAAKGIAIKVIKDYEDVWVKQKLYETKVNEQGKREYVKDEKGQLIPLIGEHGGDIYQEVPNGDKITEVEIIRYFPDIVNPETGVLGFTVINRVKFLLSMARSAGWLEKQNWKSNPAYMMMARAISRAARIAASDVIGGLYDDLEVAEIVDVEREIDNN